MKIFSAAQIKSWDAFTVSHEPIASIDLMERAATACFNWLVKNNFVQQPIHIFCGKGNNGGDGLALARLLTLHHFKAKVYVLQSASKGSADFETNLARLVTFNLIIHTIAAADDFPTLTQEDIIIDALFGTGLNKPPEGIAADVIGFIAKSAATVIAIDIPSGMYADKTSRLNTVVVANYTLSFEQYKLAFLMAENEPYTGEVQVLHIGLHKQFVADEPAVFEMVDKEMIRQAYLPRKVFAHKGTYGHALLYAGSKGMMGAAILSAKACLRSGVGLLTIAVPEPGGDILQARVPEALCITDSDEKFMEYCWHQKAVIGIGPGWGTATAAVEVLDNIIEKWKGQLLMDASALQYLALYPAKQSLLIANTILTPHPKEFDRCFGDSNNDFERVELAMQKAAKLKIYIVLKGHHTLIATPDGKGYFNSTGNAGMAKGGSGDVLTGIITGLLAQGYIPLHACMLGVYLHGLAGDIAAEKFSQEAMLPGDIILNLGAAFKIIQKN